MSNSKPIATRPLGQTGINVSPLCFGCASAFARDLINDETAVALIKQAYDYGIRFFDTGRSYGKAEERIGLALRTYPEIRNDIVISTKFGTRVEKGKYVHDVSSEFIRESVYTSLQTMGIGHIDILYDHGGTIDDLKRKEVLDCINELKNQGLIKAFGVNTFDTETIDYIAENKSCDVVMLDYNIVRQDREEQIKRLYDNGIAVIAGQALAEGLFHKDLFHIRSKKDLWYLARTIGRKPSRKLFFEARKYRFLNKLDIDASQIALKYVLDNPYVSSAAFGTCSMEHLKKNCEASAVEIPKEVLERIKKTAKRG